MSDLVEKLKLYGVEIVEGESVSDYLYDHSDDFLSKVDAYVLSEVEKLRIDLEKVHSSEKSALVSAHDAEVRTFEDRFSSLSRKVEELGVTRSSQEDEAVVGVESGEGLVGVDVRLADKLKSNLRSIR